MRETDIIGRYHLTYRIAYGGMAEIFRSFTFHTDGSKHEVAVKRLLPHLREDDHFVQMLIDEFKLASQLKHPNLVEVYELCEVGEFMLISLEFVNGKDLRSSIDRGMELGDPIDLSDAIYVTIRALEGLAYAHRAVDAQGRPLDIVHRDFSPSNLLLGYDGAVKLCDFGVAKARSNMVRTETGVIKGKVRYMSPEQAFGQKLDGRSDLFSVGSVLYELVTRHPAFNANNDVETILKVRTGEVTNPTKLRPDLPPALVKVIERSLAKHAEDRYQDAQSFRADLIAVLRVLNPDYRRTRLSHWMTRLWHQEIASEAKLYRSYRTKQSAMNTSSGDFGTNLLADVQPNDAPFTQFVPKLAIPRKKAPVPSPAPRPLPRESFLPGPRLLELSDVQIPEPVSENKVLEPFSTVPDEADLGGSKTSIDRPIDHPLELDNEPTQADQRPLYPHSDSHAEESNEELLGEETRRDPLPKAR